MAALLGTIVIVSLFGEQVFASNLSISDTVTVFSPIDNTTSYSQEQYLYISSSEKQVIMLTQKAVRLVCESFLSLAKAYVRNPEAYDATLKISADCLSKNTIQYRLSEYECQTALNEALEHIIYMDALTFDGFEATVNGEEATANIVESYTYYIDDGFDSESFRRKKYTFSLRNISGEWLITDVITDDPWEVRSDFIYQPINVQATVSAVMADIEEYRTTPVPADQSKVALQALETAASLTTWTYNESVAVAYATAHYNDTTNSTFGYASDNCQNFASQCVWAGLGGSGTSKTALPAVSTGRVGSNAFNVWCQGQSTTYYSDFYFNWAWDNVRSFAKLLKSSKPTSEGPYGNASYAGAVANAAVGDVLNVNWNGTPTESTIAHAMFVTEVLGTPGSRTKSDVKIAAHTSPTNSAYQTLSSYATGTSINNFGRVVIWQGHYSS
jgi:hypothetical protein